MVKPSYILFYILVLNFNCKAVSQPRVQFQSLTHHMKETIMQPYYAHIKTLSHQLKESY